MTDPIRITTPDVSGATAPDEYYYCGVHFEPALGWTLTDVRSNACLMISEETAQMLIKVWKEFDAAKPNNTAEVL